MTPRFDRFIGIDWSGAKGSRHPGISLAICALGNEAPELVAPPGRHWSRAGVRDWLLSLESDALIGFDFSYAPPFVKRGAYLPGDETPTDAKAFWAYVDAVSDDNDLGAASFLEQRHRRHFYFGAADGAKADYRHLRRCETLYNDGRGGKPATVFDAIGAAQVAKASFSGMRLLHHLSPAIPVWPFDPLPESGPAIVEIYTRIAARAAGVAKGRSKVRDAASLDAVLEALGSRPHTPLTRYTDHDTDAIMTAAWLRTNADRPELWHPPLLTPEIARTEGWTFGVL